jgi:hypothetical protein
MEDIKHEKFKMEMFQQLPNQRPLYAVIATIQGPIEVYSQISVLSKFSDLKPIYLLGLWLG